MIEGKRFCDNRSNPRRDIYSMLFELTIEQGTCLTAVFFVTRVIDDFICTISSSNISILKQPERMKDFKDFNSYTSLGILLRLAQSFKFMSCRLQRSPMDGCTLHKHRQSFRMSRSGLLGDIS